MAIKIILCGDQNSGKTALRINYMGLGFQPTHLMTVDADFSLRNVTIATGKYAGKKVACQIWDVAGQKSFSDVRAHFYHGIHGALLVYDCTLPATFQNIPAWVDEICKNVDRPIPMVLISNNSDLCETTEFAISSEQGKQLADLISTKYFNNRFLVPYIEVSTTTGQNIDYAFESLVAIIVNQFLSQPDHK